MKKKIISLFLICFLIFPCFLTACKKNNKSDSGDNSNQNETPTPTASYTYSVVLKNAANKIDENALSNEYDYQKQAEVKWTKENNDYKVSVSRTLESSGKLTISLKEGYDFSNITLKVNDTVSTDYSVSSGEIKNCEKTAYLTDRQLTYTYKNLNSNTNIVVDFSSCVWATIKLNVADLKANGVSYCQIDDAFVTLEDASKYESENKFVKIEDDEIVANYGSVFAFDYAHQLSFKAENSAYLQDLPYANYTARNFLVNNKIQYLIAKYDGECEVYDVVKDVLKNGTLRVVGYSGIKFATSIDLMNSNNFVNLLLERELYDGEILTLNAFKGENAYLELNEEGQKYNYYLLSKIDEKTSLTNQVNPKTDATTSKVYLEINLTDANGNTGAAKYLVRKPKDSTKFYTVYTSNLPANATFTNYSYITLGENRPNGVSQSIADKVYYCYEIDKDVNISINPSIVDDVTGEEMKCEEPIINYYHIVGGNQESLGEKIVDQNSTQSVIIHCYIDPSDPNYGNSALYEINVDCSGIRFEDSRVNLDPRNLNLYDNEKIYYTTDINDNSSWKELDSSSVLEISSNKTSAIYYLFESNRSDMKLQILDGSNNIVSVTGKLRDCFNRPLVGNVSVGGKQFDLSNVYYLTILPGYYKEYTATLTRGYDKTEHKISLSGAPENIELYISYYDYNQNNFAKVTGETNFVISYADESSESILYYYIANNVNKSLVLKDSEGNIIGKSILVHENSGAEVQIGGYYVYNLVLNANYYGEDEEFFIDWEDVTYSLRTTSDAVVETATDDLMIAKTTGLVEGKTYFFTSSSDLDYFIGDSLKKKIDSIVVRKIGKSQDGAYLYSFTFTFSEDQNFAPNSKFILMSSN